MGSECNPSKRHYDLSMSRRTRKPIKLQVSDQPIHPIITAGDDDKKDDVKCSPETENVKSSPETENPSSGIGEVEEDGIDRRSLKELIHEGEEKLGDGEEGKRGRSGKSLGHHFTQENQLQLVTKQQAEGMEGVKTGGLVSRYIKVLSHLIKVKRDPHLGSRKKPVLRLKT
ncbi:PREDICTED: uncharacterized protein LOC104597634 [Nelumbo nucifera]|uniref:Uncharacterized protein LOC104597634 n=2 Tax=Nelumbo nucifera TaxID=4432 RepID=A0A1U7ZTD6_NELNU|nr:PREDICTED: uncharacterized protein LOC104597634 [Nelumbo nucifera]DAD42123.1 TPA_asm: hypothetical protein HUJ06_000353 [Nelumbo nucifera]